MNDVHISYTPESYGDDFNKEIDKPVITPSKGSRSPLVSSAQEIAVPPMDPQHVENISLPTGNLIKKADLLIPVPSNLVHQAHLPPQTRPSEDLSLRTDEHRIEQQEKNLLVALQNLNSQAKSKGGLANQIKQVAAHPIDSAGRVGKKTKNAMVGTARFMPVVGPLKDSHRYKKEAAECHNKAKEIERELANPSLSQEEVKTIGKELKKIKKERKALKQGLKELDKTIASEYEDTGTGRMQGRVETRARLLASIKERDIAILETRAKLCNPALPSEEVRSKLLQIDQLVAEQKKHERKGHGHDVNIVHSLGSGIISESNEVAKLGAELLLDTVTTVSPLTPVSAAFGLTMATTKGALKVRNLTKSLHSLEKIKKVKREASTYQALAEHYKAVSLDLGQPESVREASKIEMEIELEKVQLIKDYLRVQKKYIQSKIVTNGLGLAGAATSIGANTCGLLVLIPEPTTSSTMYGLAVGLTGIKIGLLIAEFGAKEGSKYLEQKAEKKLWTKRDFFEQQQHDKGISRSFLGVEIRLAHMINHGFAPSGVVEYHGIVDEKGYIQQVNEKAQTLADKQELKKGLAVITEYKTYVEDHYNYLAHQRDPSHVPPKGGLNT